jgi:hypothetical protein
MAAPHRLRPCEIDPSSAQVILADENRLRPGRYFFAQATGLTGDEQRTQYQRPTLSGDARSFAVARRSITGESNLDFYLCPAARVALDKSFTVDSVVADPLVDPLRPDVGDVVNYAVTLRNDSGTLFGGTLRLTDTLPSSVKVSYGTPVLDLGGAIQVQPPVFSGNNKVTWEVRDILGGSEVTLRIPVTVRAGQNGQKIDNSVVMTLTQEPPTGQALIENLAASATLTVTQVDVSAQIDVSTQIPREGQPFDYTITVNNAGPDPATTIKVVDSVLANSDLAFVSAATGNGLYDQANRTWTIPVLAGGQSATLRLTVRPNVGAGGKAPITASISQLTFDQEDSNPANNNVGDSETIRVLGTDLEIESKSVSPASTVRNPAPGEIVTYTIVLRNRGPLNNTPNPPGDAIYVDNAAAFVPTTVLISDTLPAGLSFVSASDGGSISGGVVTWQAPGWSAGTTKTLTLRARIDALGGTVITNRVGAIRAEFANGQAMNDPVPANNQPDTQGVDFTVNSPAQVSLTLTPASITEAKRVTATVDYTDPDDLDNFTIVVNWGDGTTTNTQTSNSAQDKRVFTHVYADDDADDSYTVTATVTDSTNQSNQASRTVTVENLAPTVQQPAVSGFVRTLAVNHYLATTSNTLTMRTDFSDPGFTRSPSVESFTYQVNWGDGVIDNGTVANVTNGNFGVATVGWFNLTHRYNELGVFPVSVIVRDDDGDQTQRNFTITVNNVPTAHDDAVSVNEDSEVAGNMLANDRPDGDLFPSTTDILTVTQVSTTNTKGVLVGYNPSTGAFTYSAAGKFDRLKLGESAADSFTYQVRDSFTFTSTATVNVTVIGVNDSPRLTLTVGTRAFTEDLGAVTLDNSLTITDIDNSALVSRALVTIANSLDGADERLLTTTTRPGITPSYANGVLTLSGAASFADYQTVLRSVVYTNTDNTPSLTPRTIAFAVLDEHDAPSAPRSLTVTVQDKNDAPIVALLPFTPTEDITLSIGNRIQVIDTDAVTKTLTLTATVTNGMLSLSGAPGARQVVITTGLTQLNSLNLTYLGDADYTGADSLTVTVNDLGNNPSGPLSDSETQPFFVTAVDDAPRVDLVSVVPSTMNENTLVTAQVDYLDPDANETRTVVVDWGDGTPTSTTTRTSMSATVVFTHTYADDDMDGDTNDRYTVVATVTDSAPTLQGSESSQVTVTNVRPTLAPLTLTGTAKQIKPNEDVVVTTLVPLVVKSNFTDPGFTLPPGKEVFSTTVNWGDGSIETLPVTVTVNGKLNVATTGVFTRSHQYTDYGIFTATVTVFDDDDPTGDTESFRVTVSDIPATNDDFLALDEDSIIGGNVLANDGKSGSLDDLDVQSIDRTGTDGLVSNVISTTGAFSYTAASYFEKLALNELADDSFRYTAVNRVGFTNTATVHITVIGVNDAPVLTLNATSRPFVEDTGNTQLTPALTISDIDNDALISRALITLTNPLDGAAESIFPTGSSGAISASYSPATGVLTLSGNASLTAYQTLLRSVVYTNTDNTPTTTNRTLRFVVFDEHDAPSSLRTLTVTVQDKNDAPIVTLTPFTPTEDITLLIGNRIQVIDTDAVADSLRLTATVTHGNLTLPGATGSGARQVVITTGLTQLNSLNLTYLGDADYTGPDSLTVTVNDLGNNPSGPLSDSETRPFFVTSVDDAPRVDLVSVTPTTMSENRLVTATVSYLDPDAGETRTVVVDWGDGTPASTTTRTSTSATVVFTHTYADDDADGDRNDRYTVVATVTDSTLLQGSENAQVTVTNVLPTLAPLTLTGTAKQTIPNKDVVATTTTPLTVRGTFSDPGFTLPPGKEVFSTTVNWGDGFTETLPVVATVNGKLNVATTGVFTRSHQYTVYGFYTATVTVFDDDDPTGDTETFRVTVSDLPASSDDDFSLSEDGVIAGNVLDNDGRSGPDDDLDIKSINTVGTVGLVSNVITETGAFSYTATGRFEPLALGQQQLDTFRYTAINKVGFTNTATVNVTVIGVNDTPVLTLNATSRPFVEDMGNTQLTPALTIADVDNGALISRALITLTNPLDGAAEALIATAAPGSISVGYNSTTGVLTLSGNASLSSYQTLLRSVVYTNTDDTPTTTNRTLRFTVFDEHNAPGILRTLTVTVQDKNDAPIVALLPFTPTEDIALSIGNRVQVVDTDAVADSLRLTATVTHGNLTLPGATGSGTRQVVITTGLTQLNSLNLTYLGDADYTGADSLTVTVNDLGNNPSGPLSDSETRPFFVASVDDAPRVDLVSVVPSTMNENTLVTAQVNYIDPDAGETRTVVVDWGDGTPASTTTRTSMSATLVFTHTYADDDMDGDTNDRYTVVSTVTDSATPNLQGSESAQVTVTNVRPTLAPLTLSGTASQPIPNKDVVATTSIPLVVRGSFSDPGFTLPPGQENFTTAINWGDGSTQNLPVTVTNNGSLAVATTGVFTRSHLYTTYGIFTATVTVFDDDDPIGDTESFRVTVSDIPVASNDSFSLDENSIIGGNVLDNDGKSGPDDDLDIKSINTVGTVGLVSNVITETGAFSYTATGRFENLALGEQQIDSFSYTAINKVGFTNTSTVLITVIGVNDAPVLTLNASTRAFTEDLGNVTLAPTLTASDVDNGALISRALITLTNPLDGAAESLFPTGAAGSISASYNSTTGVLTLSGNASLTAYQTLLRSVVYTNTDDTPTTTNRTLRFTVFDEHNAPGILRMLTVTVQDKNDAPIVALLPFTPTEDIALSIGNRIQVVDVDAVADSLRLTATVTHGNLTLPGATGSGTRQVVITTGLTQLNSLNLTYLGDADYTGADSLTVTVNDLGNNPSGPLSDSETQPFFVTAVNDAPVLGSITPAVTFVENQPPVTVAANVTIVDVDSANMLTATVTLATTPDGAEEVLAATVSPGMSASYNPASRTLTLSGSATRAAYQTALRSVTYSNSDDTPTTTPRTLSFVVFDDKGAASNTSLQTVNMQATNDSPVISLSPGTTGAQEGGPPVTIDAAMTVVDPDTPILSGGRFSVTVLSGASNSDFLNIAASGPITRSGNQLYYLGVQFGVATGLGGADVTVTLNGNASTAAVQALARSMTYQRDDKGKPPASVSITFRVSDGVGGVSNLATKIVSLGSTNDAPEVVIGPVSATEDVLFTIGASVAITDFDADTGTLLMTVTVNSGTLTATGDSDANPRRVVIAGTLSVLKTRLSAMTYQGDLNFNGNDTLTVTLNDQGNTGSGGAQSDSDSRVFSVAAVNDTPTVTVTDFSATEDTSLNIRPNIVISDADASTSSLRITMTVASGTLTPSGGGLIVVSGSGTSNLVVTGSLAQFAAATITYAPALNVNGSVALNVTVNDQGAIGTGGAKSDSDAGTISISAVNDAPTVAVDVIGIAEESTTNIRSGIVIGDVDVSSSSLRITMTVTSGTLSVSGLTIVSGNGSSNVVVTGSLAQFATSTINYTPPANFVGSATLTVTANDQGATGSGGAKTGSDSGTITIAGVNDAPTVQITTVSATEDTSLNIRPSIAISDVDAGASSLRITITVASGTLTQTGLTLVSGSGTGNLVVTGSLAQFAAATITYAPALNVNGNVALNVTVNDQGAIGTGGAKSDSDAGTINIAAVNDAPTVAVDVIGIAEESTTNIRPNIVISDVDVATGSLRITMTVASGTLNAVGFTPVSGNGTGTLVILRTLAQFATSTINYTPPANFVGSATLTVTANDQGATGSGGAKTGSDSGTITIAGVNDAPTVQITTVSASEDTSLNIRPSIAISDVDAGASSLRITITVASGTLTPSGGGLTVVSGSGTSNLVVTGSLAQFAAATITYAPALNVNGNVALNVTVNDQGAIGTGGAKSDSDAGTISISAVNDAPTVAVDVIGIAEESTTNIRSGIVIGDVDVSSSSLRITMTVTSGTLSVSGLTIVSGNGSSNVVVTGSLAQFATSTINYTPPANFVGSATLTVTANDQGATGSGGAKTGSDSGTITIAGVNDAPTVQITTVSATEDTSLNIRPSITISDVDAGASSLRITITVASGTLTQTGLTLVSGSGTSNLVVTGSLAQFAAATITYAPAPNVNGNVALNVTANDQGAIGTGGAKNDSHTGTISISAVNDAPTVAVDVIGIAEESTTNIRPNIVISDVDVATGSLRITMTVASGTLNAVGFTPVSGNGTGTLVILRTLAQFATSTINYTPPANFVGSATLTVTANDQGATGSGGAKTGSDSGTITIAGVNDAPTVQITTVSATEDTSLNIRPSIAISDVDAGASSLRITITVASGTLTQTGLTLVSGSGTGNLVVTGSLAQFAAATITYAPALNVNGNVALNVTVNDQGAIGTGGAKSDSDAGTISISAVNDAPTVSIGAISVNEDVATNIRSSITISDVDVASGNLRITMTVASGTLSVSGLTIVSGNGTGNVVVTGSLAQFNASTINYTSAANASGNVSLTVAVNDQGNTGSGGAKSDSDSGTINITTVNDAPTVQITTVSATEDTSLNVRPNIVISDVDAGASSLRITITVASGTLTPSGGLIVVSGSGTSNLVVTGSLAQFAAATITYAPALNVTGNVALNVTANDQGASGSGGAKSTSTAGAINLSAVNDAPILVINSFSVGEDSTTNIRPFISLTDVDAGGSSLAFTMTVTNGTLQVSGLTVVSGNGTGVVVATGSLAIFNISIINYTPALDYIGDVQLTVAVSDQGATGAGGSLTDSDISTFRVSDVNDPPVLDLNGPAGGDGFNASFVEDQGAVSITANTLTLVDPDSTTMFSATVRISNLLDGANEVLSADPVGLVTPSYSAGVLTLSGPGSRADYEAALRTVKYNNSNQNPTTTTRAVVFVVKDAGGNMSTPVSAAVTVARTNDTPTILLPSGTLTVTEGASAEQIDAAGQVSDVDSTAFASGGFFTVTVVSGTDSRDKLDIGAFGNISTSGSNVRFNGSNIGTFTGANSATLRVTLNAGVTITMTQELLRAFTYRQTAGSNIPSRTININLKETGAAGAALAMQSVVILPNIPPELTLNATAASYSEGSAAVIFAPALTLVDSDSTNMVSATVQIDNLLDAGKETLAATVFGGIAQSYNSATGVLTLSGSSNKNNYQNTLKSVTYINSSQNPNTTPRVLRFIVTDNQALTSAPVTGTLAIVAVNDAPTVVLTALNTAEDTPVSIRPSITISDVDVLANALRITMTVNSGKLGASGLTIVSGNGTGSLVVTGNLTQFTGATITFTPTANSSSSVNLTVTANDQGATGSGGAKIGSNNTTITVNAVNDAPTVSFAALSTAEDTPLNIRPSIIISDVDVLANALRITMTVNSGKLGASALTVVSGSGTAALVVTGNLTQFTGATIMFTPTANASGAVNLTVTANDQGATGSGGAKIGSNNTTITVNAVNDAPTVSFAALSTAEDTPLNIRPSITISDVDVLANALRITMTVNSGKLGASGLTVVSGNGTGSLVVTGNLTQFTGATITFTPTANASGVVNLTVAANDQGATGSGGAKTDTKSTTISVNAVNDAPTLLLPSGTLTVTEDASAVQIDVAGQVSDVDSTTFASGGFFTVTVVSGTDSRDKLNIGAFGNISTSGSNVRFNGSNIGTFTGANSATLRVTLNAGVTITMTQELLRAFTYRKISGDDVPSRTININLKETGAAGVALAPKNVVILIDFPPVLTLNATAASYSEGSAAVIFAPALTLVDGDSTNMVSATVQIDNVLDAGKETLAATFSGGIAQSYNSATGVLTFSGSINKNNYQNALRSVIYINSSQNPSTTPRVLRFIVTDNQALTSAPVTGTLAIVAVNDAPTVMLTALNTAEDTPLNIRPSITISDVDVLTNTLRITMTVNSGKLGASGLTIVSGNGTGSLVVTGNLTQFTGATIMFTPTANASGVVNLTVSANDQGATGSGGAQTGSNSTTISVAAVNDAPTLTVNPIAATEDTPLNIRPSIIISDVDAVANNLRITVTVGSGVLTANGLSVSGGGTNKMIVTGSVAQFAAGVITYTPAVNVNGAVTMTVAVNDQGATGSGGALTTNGGNTITIAAVDDAPMLGTNAGITETTALTTGVVTITLTVTTLQYSDVDTPDSGIVFTVTVAPISGTLLLNSTPLAANSTFTQDDITNNRLKYRFDAATPQPFTASFKFRVRGEVGLPERTYLIRIQ